MLGAEKLAELAHIGLAHSRIEQTEIFIKTLDSSLSRFANNSIHQNVFESNVSVRVRLVLGNRTGVAASNDISPEGIRRTVDTARAVAQLQREDPETPPLPPAQPLPRVEGFSPRTANFSAEARSKAIGRICQMAASQDMVAAGAFRTDTYEVAGLNSLGLNAYFAGTVADLHTVVMNDAGSASGYASACSPDVGAIDAEAVAQEACARALRARDPITLSPGEYTVVLEPYAVANILQYLAWNTFNALAVQEERSFVQGRKGEKLFPQDITLYDDGLQSNAFALPFDDEGVPRKKVILVENGVARDVVYDTCTARRDNVSSTGHSLPAPNTQGPLPRHLFLAPGTMSSEDLIRSVARGVLVTRLWYTRVVHPRTVMMTGLTRDGTFLIEHGQVTLPVKNLRFTTSYIDALRNVRHVGRDAKLIRDDWFQMNMNAPPLVVDEFCLTGIT